MRPRLPSLSFAVAMMFVVGGTAGSANAKPKKAHAKTAKKVPAPAPVPPPPPPPLQLPSPVFEPTAKGVNVSVQLSQLDPSATGVVLVKTDAADDATGLVELACDHGQVVRELPRALFDAASVKDADLTLPLFVTAPDLEADKRYVLRLCLRQKGGELVGDSDPYGQVVSYPGDLSFGATVETPSGPVGVGLLRKGYAVIGYDVDSGHEVIAHIGQLKNARGPSFSVQVAGVGTVVAPAMRGFYVPSKKAFVAAADLAVGDSIFLRGGGTAKVKSVPVAGDDLYAVPIAVSGTGAYFADELLVKDAKPSKGETTDLPADEEKNTWVSAAQNYDCSLAGTLTVRDLPGDATSVALVVAKRDKKPGERMDMACGDGTVVAEIPRILLVRSKEENVGPDGSTSIGVSINGDEDGKGIVQCDAGYAMLPCTRHADGTLAPLGSTSARYGEAGSSCFVAGTPIATPDGDVAIETLVRGERLFGYDIEGGRLGTVRVHHVTERVKHDVGAIALSNGTTLRVTSEHPFYVEGGGFIVARDLRVGDALLGTDGADVRVDRVEPFEDEATVYDVSVDGPHDYFAGGVLVHNY